MARARPLRAISESGRLDTQVWIDAAREVLAEQGVEGVRVEPLAKRLGVTKGAFYWRFQDRDALCDAVLNDWRRRATLNIIGHVERQTGAPEARLLQLMALPFQGPRSERGAQVELSIRLWARHDPRAAAALEEVDGLRLSFIERLFVDCGFDAEAARARAILAYSFMRVATTLTAPEGEAWSERCLKVLLPR